MTKNVFIEHIKGIGVKRATVYEEMGNHYIRVFCRPFPSLKKQAMFRTLIATSGISIVFCRLSWHKNLFKSFQFVEEKGPFLPRHVNCRCILEQNNE